MRSKKRPQKPLGDILNTPARREVWALLVKNRRCFSWELAEAAERDPAQMTAFMTPFVENGYVKKKTVRVNPKKYYGSPKRLVWEPIAKWI